MTLATHRSPTPEQVVTKVLAASRRRCCICFGLGRDIRIKEGQIAHLDKNPDNNDVSNLAFLCFEHHNQFDSHTSQAKGFKLEEVKLYRKELHTFLDGNLLGDLKASEAQAERVTVQIGLDSNGSLSEDDVRQLLRLIDQVVRIPFNFAIQKDHGGRKDQTK